MRNQQSGFYKGIPGFRRENEDLLYRAAEHSIYEWWWEFLRLSPVLWYSKQSGFAPEDKLVARVCKQSGDLGKDHFEKWWRSTGAALFVEAQAPLKLRRVDEDALEEHVFYPAGKSMLVEVPLNVTSRTLVRDFKKLIATTNENKRVNVVEQSNAIWRLHTKRYNLHALENQFWVLVYRLLYPNIAAWRIGDRLQISPGLKLRDLDHGRYDGKSSPITRAQSTVGRFLYKAQRTVLNAERGSFPNFNPIESAELPFGKRHHSEFIAAVVGLNGELSPWQQWLHEEFHWRLMSRIKVKNRIEGMSAINPKLISRLPKFIAGESDLLA